MVKNWTKKLRACASRACAKLRPRQHPGYSPKTNTNTNTKTNPRRHHAAQAHVPEKQPTPVQTWRKTRPLQKPTHPPHERRYQALKCGAFTLSTDSERVAVVSHSHAHTLSVFL